MPSLFGAVSAQQLVNIIAMALVSDEQDGVARSTSDTPPTHYIVKINFFSLLSKNSIEKYETGAFEAGGHKWKLILHPNGNKSKNVKDHISLYLALAEASSLPPGWEFSAVFRLFLLDQNNNNYVALQDTVGNGRGFHAMKLEWGFDQFISHKAFNNVCNGYLVDDTCVFGAEVFVCRERVTGRGEHLSLMKDATSYKHTWKIENFSSKLDDCNESITFNAGSQKWKLKLYFFGEGPGVSSHTSLYLALADSTTLSPGVKIFAEFELSILDQSPSKNNVSAKATHWFSSSSSIGGWSRYVPLTQFIQTVRNYVKNDIFYVEAEVTVIAVAKPM